LDAAKDAVENQETNTPGKTTRREKKKKKDKKAQSSLEKSRQVDGVEVVDETLVGLFPQYQEQVKEMKERLFDLMKDDDFLNSIDPIDVEEFLKDIDIFRFLKARRFDIDVSMDMLINCLKWRKENDIRNITLDNVKSEIIKGKVLVPGYDKEKRFLTIIRVSLHFPSTSDKETMEKMVLFFMEICKSRLDPKTETFSLIFDLSNFSLSNMDYDLVRYLLKVFSDYYPESLGVCLVVNSPWIFKGCWLIVKPWLDPVTSKKIKFVSRNHLDQIIDKEMLPTFLGGENDNIINFGLGSEVNLEIDQEE